AAGRRLIACHMRRRGGAPFLLYFHGNGGSLAWRAQRFRLLTADGIGLLALSYRGYGGSTGRPTEAGFLKDALATYRFAVAHYPAERIALWGESIGSGVAVALAADKTTSPMVS